MSTYDTPRTDAALVESILCTEGGDEECTVYPVIEHVEADFARELEQENDKLRSALLKATGSLGLIIGGARAHGTGHKDNYENAKRVLDETFHDET